MRKIVVIGTGRMGGALATAFAKRTSHADSIRGTHAGSSSAAALRRQLGVPVADRELLAADVVFVATPSAALEDVAAALKGYAGIILSAMVPGAGGYVPRSSCAGAPILARNRESNLMRAWIGAVSSPRITVLTGR